MEKSCHILKNNAIEIINFKLKKMLQISLKYLESYLEENYILHI